MRYRLLVLLTVTLATLLAAKPDSAFAEPSEPPRTPRCTLTPWDNALLGRWIAIDNIVRRYARHYRIPAMWTMQTFASESVMNPLAKGSQPDDRGIGQVGYLAEEY